MMEPSPQSFLSDPLIQRLAERERYRDDYLDRHDPIRDERLGWRAQSLRHLLHLSPGETILELGCGRMRLTRQLARVTRHENPIIAVTFGDETPEPVEGVEHLRLDALPGALEGRTFHCVVGMDMLDRQDSASVLAAVHSLLRPGGEMVFFQSNPWNPVLRLRRLVGRMLGGRDPRGLLSRPLLYELMSDVGFIRVFAVFSDFVYKPLTPRMVWLLRNLSIVMENAPLVRNLAGTILVHAQRPPRAQLRPSRPLCDHPALEGKVSVVIPCRNEEMNVGPLLDRLIELYGPYLHEIIPVDDNSTDGTAAVMQARAAADSRIRPVFRTPPGGVGRALADGLRATRGDWILTMDCDFQHLLTEMRDMFDLAAQGAPVVTGSRFSRRSVLLNYPFPKIVSNRAFHMLANLVMGRRFRDVTNNLKLMRRDVVDRLQLTQPHFAVNAETGLQPMIMGYKIAEAPISWINRSFDMGGSSFRLIRVGGGYAQVLWNTGRARFLGSGPYAGLRDEAGKPK